MSTIHHQGGSEDIEIGRRKIENNPLKTLPLHWRVQSKLDRTT